MTYLIYGKGVYNCLSIMSPMLDFHERQRNHESHAKIFSCIEASLPKRSALGLLGVFFRFRQMVGYSGSKYILIEHRVKTKVFFNLQTSSPRKKNI